MKKILYSALALPLLFACSSEDFDNQAINNDPFAGIEKVDATFTMDESATTRFDGEGEGVEPAWKAQEGDLWGFAWLGDGTIIEPDDATNGGKAFQNHNLIQTNGIFTPQTSIYVGSYYLYRPYDGTTVSPQAINFKSLEEQPFVEGYASTTQAWKNLAKTAINIADCWTEVTSDGHVVEGKTWDKAGRGQSYKLYPAMFSNQTLLDLTYVNNNPKFAAAKEIIGATDIRFTCAKGEAVGAAVIYDATVELDGAAKSFTYAPKESPNGGAANHEGDYWADKDGEVGGGVTADDGFTFTPGAITLTPANAEEGLSTGTEGTEAKFWFNSLPVIAGDGALATNVQTKFTTSYGNVTVNHTIEDCAYEFAKFNNEATSKEWIKLADADAAATATDDATWKLSTHNTFVNQYGNHKGMFKFNVDFATGDLATLHIKSDDHLQTVLKYYIASGKTAPVVLSLDKNSSNTFALSKISIALLQTINAEGEKVTIKPCTTEGHTPTGIIITQAGQKGTALEDATDVPSLEKVFTSATSVQLSGGYNWTWKSNEEIAMGNVTSITLLPGDASGKGGKLNVTSTNVEMTPGVTLTILRGAEMNITKVTTVKNALTNKGTINVNANAELRAYGVAITNEASELGVSGTINNSGVVGVSAGVAGGSFNNYGVIDMKSEDAITLLTTNATSADAFGAAWSATNKMGTVKLPNGNPTALVSVSNATSEGFIKYNWTGATYATPAGNVKYNTIVVSGDITFTAEEEEIKYIEFDGTRTQVVNPEGANKLPQLKGVIVNAGKSIIIEMTNILNPTLGAYLGSGATVYKGGIFQKNGADYAPGAVTNYLGEWNTNQIVEY